MNGIKISRSVIKAIGNISVINNTATNSDGTGFLVSSDTLAIKTKDNFIITVSSSNQKFDSTALAITNLAGLRLPFSSFKVTVDNVVYNSYGAIPAGTVVLNSANQS